LFHRRNTANIRTRKSPARELRGAGKWRNQGRGRFSGSVF